MKYSEVLSGVICVLVESMADDRSNEVRCTYYEARDGEGKFSPKFRSAYRLQTIQGTPGESPRFNTGPHRTPTEIPLALPMVLLENSPWFDYAVHSGLA